MRMAFDQRTCPGFFEGLEIRETSITIMPRKRKKKIFSAAKVVREMARERVGSPKPSQLVKAKTTRRRSTSPRWASC
jgi:hypothetical protein